MLTLSSDYLPSRAYCTLIIVLCDWQSVAKLWTSEKEVYFLITNNQYVAIKAICYTVENLD